MGGPTDGTDGPRSRAWWGHRLRGSRVRLDEGRHGRGGAVSRVGVVSGRSPADVRGMRGGRVRGRGALDTRADSPPDPLGPWPAPAVPRGLVPRSFPRGSASGSERP